MTSTLKQVIPASLKPFLRRLYHLSLDTLDIIRGRRDSLTAPRRISCIGAGNSLKIREEFLGYFRELGQLKPREKVLDVGCGTGRMAAALLNYLDEKGSYDGFDIVKSGIDWCAQKITAKNPRFHFAHADIFNKAYNPSGKIRSEDFRFPYPDANFDFVFLTSVFTHMLPAEAERYMAEISRVLKPGGRCLITFFLLDTESRRLLIAGKTHQDFSYDKRGFWTTDSDIPETAVAYDEFWVKQLFERFCFNIVGPIHYGSWSGRQDFLSYQDIVIATRACAQDPTP